MQGLADFHLLSMADPRAVARTSGADRAPARAGLLTISSVRGIDLAPRAWEGYPVGGDEVRDGVTLTNLDQPLFDGAGATKRDLVDYLDTIRDRIIPVLEGRPLSVIRVIRGQPPFMQKNVPKYTPAWVQTVSVWAEASQRDVAYALCNDRRTLLWFANQRAVEYHPTLIRADHWDRPTHLVLDLDPPSAEAFPLAARAAQLVRTAAVVILIGRNCPSSCDAF